MAYELNLTAAQYEAVYEINLDYLMSLNGHASTICLARGLRGIVEIRFPFLLQIKYELCPPQSYPIIICWYWELAAKITDSIFIKEECQFENDGTTPFIIGQIPDALTQNGIYHRSDFILSAPNGIKVCHSILFAVPH